MFRKAARRSTSAPGRCDTGQLICAFVLSLCALARFALPGWVMEHVPMGDLTPAASEAPLS